MHSSADVDLPTNQVRNDELEYPPRNRTDRKYAPNADAEYAIEPATDDSSATAAAYNLSFVAAHCYRSYRYVTSAGACRRLPRVILSKYC